MAVEERVASIMTQVIGIKGPDLTWSRVEAGLQTSLGTRERVIAGQDLLRSLNRSGLLGRRFCRINWCGRRACNTLVFVVGQRSSLRTERAELYVTCENWAFTYGRASEGRGRFLGEHIRTPSF